MDERIKEIEDKLARAEKFAEQLQIEQDCRYLLSKIKELEEQLKHSRISDEDLTKLFEGGEDGR